ncbi:hypothetical protein BC833DRAFT_608633 [Globomyces pollinis-pini]|nr:hypothetical protein BC833DRAFT_608633 [Globomyces pollinis-pini]
MLFSLTIECGGAANYDVFQKVDTYQIEKRSSTVPVHIFLTYQKRFEAMKTKYSRLNNVECLGTACEFAKYFYCCKLPFTEFFRAGFKYFLIK